MITAPRGFRAGGTACGIKGGGERDLAVVMAEGPVPTAAVFTMSHMPAAPVVLGRRRVADGRAQAVLLNSGCANAATGTVGMEAALTTTDVAARVIGARSEDVIPCSTGPIGTHLPVGSVVGSIPELVASSGHSEKSADLAAEAILTTDTVSKQTLVRGEGFLIGGMAKGAGMLRPNMATMLAVLTTDAQVDAPTLRVTLQAAADVSFNSINIDGCTSTNDAVVLLASGASGLRPGAGVFEDALIRACKDLASKIAHDAEGTSKVVTLSIVGAVDDRHAREVGMTVADNALVRASFYGGDPNWGRVMAALGMSSSGIDPENVEIGFAGHTVATEGVAVPFDENLVESAMEAGEFTVSIRIGHGSGAADVLTTDLTPEYVLFNGGRS